MGEVRLADIANRIGVSTVTVHNALAGRKGVSDELRDQILSMAEQMGYSQGRPAKEIKRGKLKNIGIIISEKYLADYPTFYWKMYQEVALAATDKRCMVTVEILKHEIEDSLRIPRIIAEHAVEGLIIMGDISREYVRLLRNKADMPVVFLDFYDKELAEDAVVTENFYGMYLLTKYLFERGFHKMAYVGSVHATSSIMDRYCGFYKAMLEHGEVPKQEWLMEDRDETGHIIFEIPKEMPEAFVCNCDLVAGLLIAELEKRGYRVPEDISVVGFDNYLYHGFPDRGITTYEVNMKAMARAALEKVLKQIENPRAGRGLEVVAGRIVEKESVGRNCYGQSEDGGYCEEGRRQHCNRA